MTLNDLLPSSTLTGWLPLLDAIAKATIILGVAGLTTVLLRRASAASRHLVWTAALLAALVLPALSMALPRWQMAVVTLPSVASPSADGENTSAAGREMAAAMPAKATQGAETAPRETDRASVTTDNATSFAPLRPAPRAPRPAMSWPAALVLVWAVGAGLVLGRLFLGLIAVQVIARRTTDAGDARWLPLARELANDLAISRIAFRRSARAAMPVAYGVWRPTVLMPAAADGWTEDRLRIVLLHELAHVKRRDCLTHMLAQVACGLYWFNPLAWVAARRVRAERERACDDLVLAAGTPGPDYADQLLEIARVMRAGRFPSIVAGASLAMAHRSQLEGRLMAILDPSVPRSGVSRMRTFAAAAVAGAALIPLASMQTWTYEAEAAMLSPAAETMPSPGPQDAQPAPASQAAQPARQSAEPAVESAQQGPTPVADQAAAPTPRPSTAPTPRPDAEDSDKDEEAQEGKSKSDPKLVAALTAALKDTDKDVREAAMHALVQMRDPSIYEPLVQALKDPAPDVRRSAVFGLGQMRDKRAVEPLIAALKDSDAEVREQAAFALGQLRDRAAVDALALALRDANADVREQAIFALGQIRDPRAVEPLISALKDAAANAREQAAFALGQIRASSAVEALVVALKDADADVREQAAFALGQIRDPRAIDGLTVALKDANASVRQQAAFALGQLAR